MHGYVQEVTKQKRQKSCYNIRRKATRQSRPAPRKGRRQVQTASPRAVGGGAGSSRVPPGERGVSVKNHSDPGERTE